jgi:hypothetical protein
VLAGSFIRPIEARHGDTINADFGPYGGAQSIFLGEGAKRAGALEPLQTGSEANCPLTGTLKPHTIEICEVRI